MNHLDGRLHYPYENSIVSSLRDHLLQTRQTKRQLSCDICLFLTTSDEEFYSHMNHHRNGFISRSQENLPEALTSALSALIESSEQFDVSNEISQSQSEIPNLSSSASNASEMREYHTLTSVNICSLPENVDNSLQNITNQMQNVPQFNVTAPPPTPTSSSSSSTLVSSIQNSTVSTESLVLTTTTTTVSQVSITSTTNDPPLIANSESQKSSDQSIETSDKNSPTGEACDQVYNGKDGYHQCPYCNYGTTHKYNFKRHVVRKHSKSDTFSCKTCLFVTESAATLASHVEKHKKKSKSAASHSSLSKSEGDGHSSEVTPHSSKSHNSKSSKLKCHLEISPSLPEENSHSFDSKTDNQTPLGDLLPSNSEERSSPFEATELSESNSPSDPNHPESNPSCDSVTSEINISCETKSVPNSPSKTKPADSDSCKSDSFKSDQLFDHASKSNSNFENKHEEVIQSYQMDNLPAYQNIIKENNLSFQLSDHNNLLSQKEVFSNLSGLNCKVSVVPQIESVSSNNSFPPAIVEPISVYNSKITENNSVYNNNNKITENLNFESKSHQNINNEIFENKLQENYSVFEVKVPENSLIYNVKLPNNPMYEGNDGNSIYENKNETFHQKLPESEPLMPGTDCNMWNESFQPVDQSSETFNSSLNYGNMMPNENMQQLWDDLCENSASSVFASLQCMESNNGDNLPWSIFSALSETELEPGISSLMFNKEPQVVPNQSSSYHISYKDDLVNFQGSTTELMPSLDDNRFRCLLCTYSAKKFVSFLNHMKSIHRGKDGLLVCGYCSFVTHDEGIYPDHMKSHRRKPKSRCSSKKTDKKKKSSTISYPCTFCTYIGRDRYCLKRHMARHLKEEKLDNNLPVNLVNESNIEKSNQIPSLLPTNQPKIQIPKNHFMKLQSSKNKSLKTKISKIQSSTNYSVKIQSTKTRIPKTHIFKKSFKCPHCSYDNKLACNFKYHLKSKHPNSGILYSCYVCSYSTLFQKVFLLHNQRHVDSLSSRQKFILLQNKKTLICQMCRFATKSKILLKIHLMRHNEDKQLHCQRCEFRTNSKSLLYQHTFLHPATKRYKCPYCWHDDSQIVSYMEHFVIKHSVKGFYLLGKKLNFISQSKNLSEICNKDNLKQKKTGDPIRPKRNSYYNCKVCDYSTKDKKRFAKHSDKHNVEGPIPLDQCKYKANEHKIVKVINIGHQEDSIGVTQVTDCGEDKLSVKELDLKCKEQKLIVESEFRLNEEEERLIVKEYNINHKERKIIHDKPQLNVKQQMRQKILSKKALENISIIDTTNGDKLFTCTFCTYISKYKHNVKRHQKKHFMDSNHDETNGVSPSPSKKLKNMKQRIKYFKCQYCSYTSHFRQRYRVHLLRQHPKQELLFSCKKCSYSTYRKYKFDLHYKSHENEPEDNVSVVSVMEQQCQKKQSRKLAKQRSPKNVSTSHKKQKQGQLIQKSFAHLMQSPLQQIPHSVQSSQLHKLHMQQPHHIMQQPPTPLQQTSHHLPQSHLPLQQSHHQLLSSNKLLQQTQQQLQIHQRMQQTQNPHQQLLQHQQIQQSQLQKMLQPQQIQPLQQQHQKLIPKSYQKPPQLQQMQTSQQQMQSTNQRPMQLPQQQHMPSHLQKIQLHHEQKIIPHHQQQLQMQISQQLQTQQQQISLPLQQIQSQHSLQSAPQQQIHLPHQTQIQQHHQSQIQSQHQLQIHLQHQPQIALQQQLQIPSQHQPQMKQVPLQQQQISSSQQQMQSPDKQKMQSSHQSQMQSPQQIHSPLSQQQLQTPPGQQIQSPQQQLIHSPQGQPIQSPQGQQIQSPQRQQIQSPQGQQIDPLQRQQLQSPQHQLVQSPQHHLVQSPQHQLVQSPQRPPLQSPPQQPMQLSFQQQIQLLHQQQMQPTHQQLMQPHQIQKQPQQPFQQPHQNSMQRQVQQSHIQQIQQFQQQLHPSHLSQIQLSHQQLMLHQKIQLPHQQIRPQTHQPIMLPQHKLQVQQASQQLPQNVPKQNIFCSLCSYKTNNAVNLKRHTQRMHSGKEKTGKNASSLLSPLTGCNNFGSFGNPSQSAVPHPLVNGSSHFKSIIVNNQSFLVKNGESADDELEIFCRYPNCVYKTNNTYNLKRHLVRRHSEKMPGNSHNASKKNNVAIPPLPITLPPIAPPPIAPPPPPLLLQQTIHISDSGNVPSQSHSLVPNFESPQINKMNELTISLPLDTVPLPQTQSESNKIDLQTDQCNSFSITENSVEKTEITKKVEMEIREHELTGHYFRCLHCTFKTENMEEIKTHLKTKHSENTHFFSCEMCPFNTKNVQSFITHLKSHKREYVPSNSSGTLPRTDTTGLLEIMGGSSTTLTGTLLSSNGVTFCDSAMSSVINGFQSSADCDSRPVIQKMTLASAGKTDELLINSYIDLPAVNDRTSLVCHVIKKTNCSEVKHDVCKNINLPNELKTHAILDSGPNFR